MVLSRSRYKYVFFSDTPFTSYTAIEAHEKAFAFYGGITKEIVYDQDKIFLANENKGDLLLTDVFKNYCRDRAFRLHFCRKADPESKGKVENVVLANGLYKIIMKASDLEHTGKDSVMFEIKKTVGIEDTQTEERTLTYPNPVEDILHIKYTAGLSMDAYRTIYSSDGKLIERKTLGNITEEDLDVTSYKSGMYILHIADGKNMQEYKFIKK